MITRRHFIKRGVLAISAMMVSNLSRSNNQLPARHLLVMPDESGPHQRTWMAYVANDYIWSKRQIPEVKRNLILIAKTIAKYEPVSMLVSPDDYDDAMMHLGHINASPYPIELVEFETDDLWLRDTGPTFVVTASGEKLALDFNFNGWGNKQEHSRDAMVAKFIAQQSGVRLKQSTLVLEGGCFEVDGHGTAILTKSCVLNNNRNPFVSQQEAEQELKQLLGLRKIIWLDGVKGRDITDGHTDFYARFSKPGEVVVSRDNYPDSYDYQITRDNIKILRRSTDADGNKLKVIILDAPDSINETFGVSDFAAGYIGYYVCNGAVIAQKFGDRRADAAARTILERAFPGRRVEQLAIDGIASGGGSIHCATQQEIKI